MWVNSMHECFSCGLQGFFCETPDGADYNTCPCCNTFDFSHEKYDYSHETCNDMRNMYSYCSKCKIIFELGCIHHVGGCTSNVYNCHFIKKWRNKVTNIEYDGMPLFDSDDEWFNNVNDVEVLQMWCPHKNNKCVNGYHNECICKLN